MGTTENLENRKERLAEAAKELQKTMRNKKGMDSGMDGSFKIFRSEYLNIIKLIQNTIINFVDPTNQQSLSAIPLLAQEKGIIKDHKIFQQVILAPKIYSEERYIGGYENALGDCTKIISLANEILQYAKLNKK